MIASLSKDRDWMAFVVTSVTLVTGLSLREIILLARDDGSSRSTPSAALAVGRKGDSAGSSSVIFSRVAAWMVDGEHGVRLRDSEYGADENASMLDGMYARKRRDNINMVNGFRLKVILVAPRCQF
mmetsp:Transcript_16932/g.27510  ORF Transcript_16932/g.27510 Transcript_16932/m.27510 type:complete len:126 (-) Transcript_16932:259-636(-)